MAFKVHMEKHPKEPKVEEFGEEFYSDLYDDLSMSTVTMGPNVTEYEVSKVLWFIAQLAFTSDDGKAAIWSHSWLVKNTLVLILVIQVMEYVDYENSTDGDEYHAREYEEYEEYEDRYGLAEREKAETWEVHLRNMA